MLEPVPAAYVRRHRPSPQSVASSSLGPTWAVGGSVPCPQVLWQCSENPPLLSHFLTFCQISTMLIYAIYRVVYLYIQYIYTHTYYAVWHLPLKPEPLRSSESRTHQFSGYRLSYHCPVKIPSCAQIPHIGASNTQQLFFSPGIRRMIQFDEITLVSCLCGLNGSSNHTAALTGGIFYLHI